MSQGRILTGPEFVEVLHDFEHTAFRLELQDSYLEAEEADLFGAFLRGNPPPPPVAVPELREWYARIASHVATGKSVERVRVHQDPPTDYQRFERWMDHWNIQAGEAMRYLTRQQASDIGLLPAAGSTDWWLLDSARIIAMRFDEAGHRIENELVTDPAVVVQACMWRDLAVHHSVPSENGDAARLPEGSPWNPSKSG